MTPTYWRQIPVLWYTAQLRLHFQTTAASFLSSPSGLQSFCRTEFIDTEEPSSELPLCFQYPADSAPSMSSWSSWIITMVATLYFGVHVNSHTPANGLFSIVPGVILFQIDSFKLFILYLCVCVPISHVCVPINCVCVPMSCVCAYKPCVCRCQQETGGGAGSPETGLTGGCELLRVKLVSSERAAHSLNCSTMSPVPACRFIE